MSLSIVEMHRIFLVLNSKIGWNDGQENPTSE
jgi:hypothetical protein